ncbi:hypothetical protein FE257_003966 [Aspergillus nanangensis]|uniref:Uncharacterized protein n=1 Tax=Aspergillus nanangensis TaxID=2582783 RepID=A0AAD4CRQ7_ASPNN|nr:hypothetical protein FE257_003966 [Aspergillus nanangensis]
MAALTMTPTMRQPFAPLDAPRMRSLLKTKMNLKNQHDGALLSGKRQPLSVMDAENIDPATRLSKRKRSCDEDDHDLIKGPSKPLKASRMALTTTTTTNPTIKSNLLSSLNKTTATSISTPRSFRPIGRSPQPKSSKPTTTTIRRSTITKSRPSNATPSRSVKRPFSIATALSGGKPKTTPSSTTLSLSTKTPPPASWSFEIHIDSEQDEMTNLMQHSTCVLDISDDESKHASPSSSSSPSAGRGKENIPPAELGIVLSEPPVPVASRKASSKMVVDGEAEEERAPLGELVTSDFYAEGCHAFSCAVVYDEEEQGVEGEKKKGKMVSAARHPPRSKLSSVSSISAILEESKEESKEEVQVEEAAPPIDIWESASAADENAETDRED